MKRLSNKPFLISCLLLAGLFGACSGGPTATTGGTPAVATPSPRSVSSSADVVKIHAEQVSLSAGGNIDAKIVLSISRGFHVNANPATFSYLIPTELSTGKIEGITVGAPAYPVAVKKKFVFAEQPLAVYEGEAPIKLNLRADKNAEIGSRSLPINVKVQACDQEQCFPPGTLNLTISVTVK